MVLFNVHLNTVPRIDDKRRLYTLFEGLVTLDPVGQM